VCSAGHGGQVLLSQSTTAVLEDERLDGIEVRELGHHHLDGFEQPERIFQLVVPGLRTDFPPLRAQYHLGRLIDHVHLRVRDLEASKRFYGAVLESLGRTLSGEGDGFFWADELFASDDAEPTARLHLAFQARDRDTVERFHEAALAAGGRDNGGPGERRYHPGYYAAYVLDPDGNNIEAVFHGESTRSAASVVVTPEGD
jgi:catechol 2,3-dioxygenase-like lactoylglutathione lyase family enzyme